MRMRCTCGAEIEGNSNETAEWEKLHGDCLTYWKRSMLIPKEAQSRPYIDSADLVANGEWYYDLIIKFSNGKKVTIPFIKEYAATDAFSDLHKIICDKGDE